MAEKLTSEELTELALRARTDRDALDELMVYELRYGPGWVRCSISDSYANDFEDITQDILFSIAHAIPTFDGTSAFATWCIRVMKNRLYDWIRVEGCAKRRMEYLYADMEEIGGDCEIGSTLESDELFTCLIGMASEVNRHALNLVFDQGYRISEIAELYGEPYSRIRMRVRHGLADIKYELERRAEKSC